MQPPFSPLFFQAVLTFGLLWGNSATAQVEAKETANEEVWESTASSPFSSIAEEVTGGVRVEDIVEPPSEYLYAAFGKPDPFVPPIVNGTRADGESVDSLEVPIISPLQRFDLSQLSVVGIYQLSSGERKAMVLPSGTRETVIVRIGDPIGKKGGRVLSIGRDNLTVREFTLAVDGTREFEDKQLFLGNERQSTLSGSLIFEPGRDEPILNLNQPLINREIPAAVPEKDPDGTLSKDQAQKLAKEITDTLNKRIGIEETPPTGEIIPNPVAPVDEGNPFAAPAPSSPGGTAKAIVPAGAAPAGGAADGGAPGAGVIAPGKNDNEQGKGKSAANPKDPTNDSTVN